MFLRLTASALISLQMKQRLISILMPKLFTYEYTYVDTSCSYHWRSFTSEKLHLKEKYPKWK